MFGPIILLLDLVADTYYFWKNNFRTDLQKIIVSEPTSKLQHLTVKEILMFSAKYRFHKIPVINSRILINFFKSKFNVKGHIQYLMFG
jgi:hypothetical protein